ncbi:MAG: hypothetical protein COS82_11325 [Zetaproteobacteria bacterium CG06_land_8_20_14_3_00_59_53]|nr:MAG: hypothetical protein COX56_04530 [Zetaproteobacteria bacterium CG23_combo_of_CG06-09_8_20_14_all_59_86]PIQ64810.1 MAG: hypothetical protein COV97_07000 [Zetaproteobacteria bacterium CG11_big_fil_rev_8_21_14_0_20_59_439]PIU69489.1 MAG: hypothetical protein COS82_11325 [Zetaproteobacteria bacterium CG06_land_8_20_14_3_00_59_53]PIU96758.1 MAG: hypothetical protein COS62_07075 [Zetaproteobacteria bacterium CG03_land_8_20_14_0_80_59_51]PIY46819.1 MAG: hypothetical protein COZ02_04275 [Zetapr
MALNHMPSAMPDSSGFFAQMPGCAEFSRFSDSASCQRLPEGWCVVITDLCDSTGATREGRYKQVNAVGVASIVAMLNAVKPLQIPYAFGGSRARAWSAPSIG